MASIEALAREFKRLIKAGKLFHGYIFFGESPRANERCARGLAAFLAQGVWDPDAAFLPDVRFTRGEEGAIGIDEIRSLNHFLSLTPIAAPRRTAIVVSADRLTMQAQNAVLKIAEEPPPKALVLITARHRENLLPTFRSRLPSVYVSERLRAEDIPRRARDEVRRFLGLGLRERSQFLKELLEDRRAAEGFIAALILELREKKPVSPVPQKAPYVSAGMNVLNPDGHCPKAADVSPWYGVNWDVLGKILRRLELINRFNVNVRLQLESVLLEL